MPEQLLILVADNNDADRATMVAAVRAAAPDAEVVEATSGREATRLIRRHKPALSILDLYMHPGTGPEAAEVAQRLGLEAKVVTGSTPLSAARKAETTQKDDAGDLVEGWVREAEWLAGGNKPKPPRKRRRPSFWQRLSGAPA